MSLGRDTVRVVLAAAVISVGLLGPSSAPPAAALAKIQCKQTVGAAAVDPIVHHDQARAMVHVHQFFGNDAWLHKGNHAVYRDLVGRSTKCENAADTAGYWVPQLRTLSGKPIPIQAFTAYYRPFTGVGGPDFGPGEVIHANTRLVGMAHDWTCGQFSNTRPTPRIPSCAGQSGKPGHTLTAHVTFPNCWDGTPPGHRPSDVGDTRDNKHWAYKVRGKSGWTCPSGFPHRMIELRETIQYAYTGSGANLKLTSDAMHDTSDGRSLHADFWNTWKRPGLRSVVRNCIHRRGHYTASQCG